MDWVCDRTNGIVNIVEYKVSEEKQDFSPINPLFLSSARTVAMLCYDTIGNTWFQMELNKYENKAMYKKLQLT